MLVRTDKNTRVLMLYNKLLEGESVSKASFAIENNITERSFDRDIQDIRIFLSEVYSPEELIYDKNEGAYKLQKLV